MKDQRTPGIWQVDSAGTYVEVIEDGESVAIANCEDNTTMPTERCRANAAFIVRACNAHDALIATLWTLANEVGGLDAFEVEVRSAISNTNWGCLKRRAADARELLTSMGLSDDDCRAIYRAHLAKATP